MSSPLEIPFCRPPFTARRSLLLALLLAGLNSLHAATARVPDGKRIYQKQCASCHGHDVVMGTRDVAKLAEWAGKNPQARVRSLDRKSTRLNSSH